MPRIYDVLDRFFAHEIISGNHRREYLHRWVLWRGKASALYLHHFVGSDWSRDLHDHPKPFLSIGLLGRYCEEFTTGGGIRRRIYRAPWIRRFPALHRHRLIIAAGETCWTLVRVGSPVREWGFWIRDEDLDRDVWIPWQEYVYSSATDERVAPAFERFE